MSKILSMVFQSSCYPGHLVILRNSLSVTFLGDEFYPKTSDQLLIFVSAYIGNFFIFMSL